MNMKPEGIGYVLYWPGVIDFLKTVTPLFEVVIYTASVKEYADPIIDSLEAHVGYSFYRLYRQHCQPRRFYFVKDLRWLGRELKNVMIIDNLHECFEWQPNNGLPIRAYFTSPTDSVLQKYIPLLEHLSIVPDVRVVIEKVKVRG